MTLGGDRPRRREGRGAAEVGVAQAPCTLTSPSAAARPNACPTTCRALPPVVRRSRRRRRARRPRRPAAAAAAAAARRAAPPPAPPTPPPPPPRPLPPPRPARSGTALPVSRHQQRRDDAGCARGGGSVAGCRCRAVRRGRAPATRAARSHVRMGLQLLPMPAAPSARCSPSRTATAAPPAINRRAVAAGKIEGAAGLEVAAVCRAGG